MPGKRSNQRQQRRYDPLAVLAYIATYQQTHRQRSPSQRRIQAALDISAPSVVHHLVRWLQRAELLTITSYGRGQSVDLTLTAAGHEAVQRWQAEHPAPDSSADPETS